MSLYSQSDYLLCLWLSPLATVGVDPGLSEGGGGGGGAWQGGGVVPPRAQAFANNKINRPDFDIHTKAFNGILDND